MKEVLRSSNIIVMQAVRQALDEAGIETMVLDEHSGALFGGIGGIGPRLMVLDDTLYEKALEVIRASDLPLG